MTATASIVMDAPLMRLRRAVRPGPSADESTTATRRFPRHSVEEFEWLAVNDPAELVRLALGELSGDVVLLSEAVEAMAMSHQATLVVPVLLRMLDHERPFVRESALLGLSPFVSGSLHARDKVRGLARYDSSPGVREAAADVLALL